MLGCAGGWWQTLKASFLLFLVISPVVVRRYPSKAMEGREGSLCLHCEGSNLSWWKVMVVGSHTMRLLPVPLEAAVCRSWRTASFSVLGTPRPYLSSENALSPPLKPFWKQAHRHTQRCVAMAILNPVKLTKKINQHRFRPHAPACIAAVSSFNKAWMFTAILWMFQVLALQDK